ncbi:MAG: ligand-binding sensor domain-containing protein [Saprospiraceae bacterium]|jgi:ligand-binding sensor domain-containing protein
MKNIITILLLLSSISTYALTPKIHSFTPKQYNGHQSNYDAVFDEHGNLFVANTYGVMVYDGDKWTNTPLPGGTSPISLSFSRDNVLFVGGYNEMGYIKKDKYGVYNYTSLIDLLPRGFDNKIGWVSYCVAHQDKVYFASEFNIYVYNGTEISVIKPEPGTSHSFLGIYDHKLFVIEDGQSVFTVDSTGVSYFKNGVDFPEFRGIEKTGTDEYVVYGTEQIFNLKGNKLTPINKLDFIGKQTISDVIITDNEKIISTQQRGIYVLDNSYNLKYHFNLDNSSIADNYIYQISLNEKGDICLATNNGISIINFGFPMLNIGKTNNVYGAGYSSYLKGNEMYLGTSQGLYYCSDWKNNKNHFQKIDGTKSFIYDIAEINGDMFLGDQSDFYQLIDSKIHKLSETPWQGAWCIREVPDKEILLVGTYYGIDVYRKINGKWKFGNKLEGYKEAGRTLEYDNIGNLWACSGLNGFYKLQPADNYEGIKKATNYCEINNEANGHFIELIKDEDKLYVSSKSGLYQVINGELHKDSVNTDLDYERIRKIEHGGIYTLENNKSPIVLKKSNKHLIVDSLHVLNSINIELIGNNEMINQIEEDKFLIGTSEGFAIVQNSEPISYFGEVKISAITDLKNDSAISLNKSNLSFDENDLRFTFSYSAMEKLYEVEWYTMLSKKGQQGTWKSNQKSNYKEITNIHEGDYELKIKVVSRNSILGEHMVSFSIAPPWYRSRAAKSVYFVIFMFLIFVLYKTWIARLKKERKKLTLQKEKELQMQQNEHKEEILKKEILEKETEISYLALNYSQKSELLKHVSGKLSNLMKNINNPQGLMSEIKSLRFSLQDIQKGEEQKWNEFQIHFNSEHNDFVTKIKEMDPKIKESNLLMCTYVKMGKTNKEICDLLNISINALDKRKSRLKIKFEAPEEETFNEYIRKL